MGVVAMAEMKILDFSWVFIPASTLVYYLALAVGSQWPVGRSISAFRHVQPPTLAAVPIGAPG